MRFFSAIYENGFEPLLDSEAAVALLKIHSIIGKL
jgi:hypothetical protein